MQRSDINMDQGDFPDDEVLSELERDGDTETELDPRWWDLETDDAPYYDCDEWWEDCEDCEDDFDYFGGPSDAWLRGEERRQMGITS